MTRIATSQFIFFVVIADFVVVESELVLKRFFRSRSNISRETLIWVDLNYVKIVLGRTKDATKQSSESDPEAILIVFSKTKLNKHYRTIF